MTALLAVGVVPVVNNVFAQAQPGAQPAISDPIVVLASGEAPAMSGDPDTKTSFCNLKPPASAYALDTDPSTPTRSNCVTGSALYPVVLNAGTYGPPATRSQWVGPTKTADPTAGSSGW